MANADPAKVVLAEELERRFPRMRTPRPGRRARLCRHRSDPVTVMSHLDALFADPDMFGGQDLPHLVTLIYLLADGDSVELANAGHPPPLLLDPDGRALLLRFAESVPLGVQPEGRTAGRIELRHGAPLLVYTDGLIERRGEDIDVGLDRLRASAGSAARADPERRSPPARGGPARPGS